MLRTTTTRLVDGRRRQRRRKRETTAVVPQGVAVGPSPTGTVESVVYATMDNTIHHQAVFVDDVIDLAVVIGLCGWCAGGRRLQRRERTELHQKEQDTRRRRLAAHGGDLWLLRLLVSGVFDFVRRLLRGGSQGLVRPRVRWEMPGFRLRSRPAVFSTSGSGFEHCAVYSSCIVLFRVRCTSSSATTVHHHALSRVRAEVP